MAKKKDDAEQAPEPAKVVTSSFLKNMMSHAEETFGERNFMASDSEKFATGIPFKHLSQMYLFQMTVFPLSKSIGIAGKPASCKSALGFNFIRLLCDNNGYGQLLDCESGKFSPQLIRSLVSDKYVDQGRMGMTTCASINEAQIGLTKFTDGLMELDPERSIPLGFIVDSLTGSEADEAIEKINREGMAEKAFPIAALSWTRFFKVYSARLLGWPISFIFINHMKEKPPPPGQGHLPPSKTTPGGVAQWFHASVYIYTTLLKDGRRATREVVGDTIDCPNEFRRLKLFTEKNSLAPGKKTLMIDFAWYYDEDGKQVSYFDWETATAELLAMKQSPESDLSAPEKKELRSICDVSYAKGSYSSDALGLEGVNGVTIGNAITANAELMKKLIRFFHISSYPAHPLPELDDNGIPIPRSSEKDKKAKKKDKPAEAAPELTVT